MAAAGQPNGGQTSLGLHQAAVKPCGGAAGGGDAGDARVLPQQAGDIIGDGIPDGAVRGAGDGTAGQHIPQGQTVGEQQLGAALAGLGVLLAVQGRDDRPKAVLRVGVVKSLRAAAGTGHGPQDEGMAFRCDERSQRMQNSLRHRGTSGGCRVQGRPGGPRRHGAARRPAAAGSGCAGAPAGPENPAKKSSLIFCGGPAAFAAGACRAGKPSTRTAKAPGQIRPPVL